jgi:hypothetical protein
VSDDPSSNPELQSSSRSRGWPVAFAIAAAVVAVAALAVSRPDLMLVEHVVFVGSDRAAEGELRHLADLRNGTTMWGVDLARAGGGVARHPWVRGATAVRRWPDTIVIEVDEYRPAALLQGEGLSYVDAEGAVFLQVPTDSARAASWDLDLPVITGLDPSLRRLHPDLPGLVVGDALSLLAELDERGFVSRDRVSEVNFSTSRGFTVHLVGGARVIVDLEGRERQLGRLALLLEGGLDLSEAVLVDLAPASLAIVRPLPSPGGEG